MITETLEYKTKKAEAFDRNKILRSTSAWYDLGALDCETILTAQHDKEIIELLNWIERARWEPYETGFFAKYGWNMETEYKTPAELLQLFRERNK